MLTIDGLIAALNEAKRDGRVSGEDVACGVSRLAKGGRWICTYVVDRVTLAVDESGDDVVCIVMEETRDDLVTREAMERAKAEYENDKEIVEEEIKREREGK